MSLTQPTGLFFLVCCANAQRIKKIAITIFYFASFFFVTLENVMAEDCAKAAKLLNGAGFNDLDKAIEASKECPGMAESYYQIGVINFQKKDYKNSIENLNKAIAINKDPIFQLALVNIYLQQRDLAKAEQILNSVVEQTPDNTKALHGLAVLAELKGDLPLAEEQIRKAIQIEPDNATLFGVLGLILAKQTRFDEAVESLKAAKDKGSNLAEVDLTFARLLNVTGKQDESLKRYRSFLLLNPKIMAAWLELGSIELSRDNISAAELALKSAKEISPTENKVLIFENLLKFKKGQKDEAFQALSTMYQSNQEGTLANAYGWVLLQLSKLDLAEEVLKKAHLANPSDISILENLSVLFQKQNRPEDQTKALEQINKLLGRK